MGDRMVASKEDEIAFTSYGYLAGNGITRDNVIARSA